MEGIKFIEAMKLQYTSLRSRKFDNDSAAPWLDHHNIH